MTINLDTVLSRHPNAAFRVYDGQATIVMSDPGETKVLNEVGSVIWSQFDGTKTLGQILEAVMQQFDISREQVENDLLEFATSLNEHHMVT